MAILPSPPITKLPREKPLPKPKPLTTWERFAKAKGISHKKREKDVWDEERQMFVPRWGKDGMNKLKEEQWIREVKAGDGESQRMLLGERLGLKTPRISRRRPRPDRHVEKGTQRARGKEQASARAQRRQGCTSCSRRHHRRVLIIIQTWRRLYSLSRSKEEAAGLSKARAREKHADFKDGDGKYG